MYGIAVALVNLREDPYALREIAGNQGPYHPRYWPVRPSMHSRSRSACPQWRAYSSTM